MSSNSKQLTLLLGDVGLLYLALFLAITLRHNFQIANEQWASHWPLFTAVFFVWLVIFYLNGLYNLRQAKNNLEFFGSFLTAVSFNLIIAIIFFYAANLPQLSPKTILALLVAIYLPLFTLWRLLLHFLLGASALKTRLIFIGLNQEAVELINVFFINPQLGYETAAVICENECLLRPALPTTITLYRSLEELPKLIEEKSVDTVILATLGEDERINRLLYETVLGRVNVLNSASFFEDITHRVPLSTLSEGWFLENLKERQKNSYDWFKRLTDVILAIVVGAIFLTLLPFLALLIFLFDRGPIFYRHERAGRNGQPFTIYKLRTMIPQAEKNGAQFTQINDPRITKIGRLLRLTRLDELPQIWNIFNNEMSFIGPRPERPQFVSELQKMMPYYSARHLVKPGLTGWSQVSYGYADTLEGNLIKLQYDLFYIKNRSFLLDCVILLKTVNTIVKRLGR